MLCEFCLVWYVCSKHTTLDSCVPIAVLCQILMFSELSLLFSVYCVLFAVFCLLFSVCCVLFAVYCLLCSFSFVISSMLRLLGFV